MQENQKSGLSWSQPNSTDIPAQSGMKPLSQVTQNHPMYGGKSVQSNIDDQRTSTTKIVLIFVGGLVVGTLLGWWIGVSRASKPAEQITTSGNSSATVDTNTDSNINKTNDSVVVVDTNAQKLVISSPQKAGLQVSVDYVSVSRATWVVIYESHNGTPGNALGAALFNASQKSGAVELLRGTLPGSNYIAGEALDDGDRIFSLQNDKPVRDESGNPLWVEFKTR